MFRILSRILLLLIVGQAVGAHGSSAADEPSAPAVDQVVDLLDLVLDADEQTARKCLGVLAGSVQNGSLDAGRVKRLREQLGGRLAAIVDDRESPLQFDAALLTASWGDEIGVRFLRSRCLDAQAPADQRLAGLSVLLAVRDPSALQVVERALSDPQANSVDLRGQMLAAASRADDLQVAVIVLERFAGFEPELKSRAIELLTQRPVWSKPLLAAVAENQIPKESLNLNQLRRVSAFKDDEVRQQFQKLYGTIREGRNPNREQVYYQMRDFLHGTPGDPHQGVAVFKKVCAQCHKLHGEGADVGPDITRNGRNNWDQLLQNVFDPSAVIGPGYQARMLATADGRVLTGLPVEESDQRVVLKIQGGKLETIPRDQIDEYKVSELSMMPEELEKLITPQELADLFAYLALDRPPTDPEAKLLPGAPTPQTRPEGGR